MEPNQPPQGQTQGQGPDKKTILAVVVVLIILALAYVVAVKYDTKSELEDADKASETKSNDVVVEYTEKVDGVLPAPNGFPQDLPIDKDNILESATTQYPNQRATQLSLSYQTSETVAHEYGEYKDYMTRAGYVFTEGNSSAPIKALFGTRRNANLSIVVSSQNNQTLVQIAYLLK